MIQMKMCTRLLQTSSSPNADLKEDKLVSCSVFYTTLPPEKHTQSSGVAASHR